MGTKIKKIKINIMFIDKTLYTYDNVVEFERVPELRAYRIELALEANTLRQRTIILPLEHVIMVEECVSYYDQNETNGASDHDS